MLHVLLSRLSTLRASAAQQLPFRDFRDFRSSITAEPTRLTAFQPFSVFPKKTARAEGVGFEPTEPFGSTVFQTVAIVHSAIPPP